MSTSREHLRRQSCARWTCGLFVLLVAALGWAGSGSAFADVHCIPQASGVPALSGAPNFLDAAPGEPNYWPRLDDPRWRGALARGFGNGASEGASFRVLRVGGASPMLYMSWYVKVDPQLDPFVDSLRVAFSTGAGSDEMIEVFPFTSVAGDLSAAPPPSTQTRLLSAGAWGNAPAEPAWLAANTRVWLDKGNQQWAINMRLPIAAGYDAGINLPAEFRIAFELQVSQAGGTLVAYRLSDAVPLNNLATVPAAATWPAFNITLAPGAAGCIKGISIAASDVGTTNVDAAMVPRPNRISLSGVNTFFALPNNESGAQVPASQIAATFRIANWGTQPNWNDVPNPTTSLWKQLNSSVVTNAAAINNNSKASIASGNALTFPWTPTATERCEFTGKVGIPAAQSPDGTAIPGNPACANANPTRRLHQCMLVELSGGGLTYNPSSVYRNMDFVEASSFEREAEISVAGLAALGGGATKRDVYLYVQTMQMPKDVIVSPPPLTLVNFAKLQEILSGGDHDRATGTTAAAPKVPERPPLGGDFETLNQLYPTYVVHAFHDTGTTLTVRGQNYRVLHPQSSFGYYVHHDGTLTGWDTALDGAQEIAPNYYRIAVPEGGSDTVKTRVTAREHEVPPPPGFNRWWVLILILILLLVLFFLRRKTGP